MVQPVVEHLDVAVLYMSSSLVSVAARGIRSCVESIDRKQVLHMALGFPVTVTSWFVGLMPKASRSTELHSFPDLRPWSVVDDA